MKLVKTVPFALFLLSTGAACSSTPTPPMGSGGAAASGGSPSTGGTLSTGGAPSTTGGTSSTGGAPSTTGGTTGTGGADGSGGADPLAPSTILPGLDGTFWAFRALNEEDPGDGKYWVTAPDAECPADFNLFKEYQAGGTPGQQYTIHFQFRGALALRCYEGGTPTGMLPDAAGVNESFYSGGALSGAGPLNAIGLTVVPAAPDAAAGTYFLNGIPSDSAMCDQTITYDVGYEASFTIMGDSLVTLKNVVPDCQALQNCGAAGPPATCAPRDIDMTGVEVHASPSQPISDYLGGGFFYPQWLVVDITSITTP